LLTGFSNSPVWDFNPPEFPEHFQEYSLSFDANGAHSGHTLCMVAYAAQSQPAKPVQGSTASMLTLPPIKTKNIK